VRGSSATGTRYKYHRDQVPTVSAGSEKNPTIATIAHAISITAEPSILDD
jgi:hypothetical protein